MDASAEIKKIYYAATKATIQKDLERALDLLKTIPTEEDRDRVAVYIHGLTEMRAEWRAAARPPLKPASASRRPPASGRRPAAPPARSDRSKASSRRTR
jgi:hypothetical protein